MISTVRNGQSSRKLEISIKKSKFCIQILRILIEQGYIKGYQEKGKQIKVFLKYVKGKPAITELKIPKGKILQTRNLKKSFFLQGLGLQIINTSKGLLSDYEAIKLNLGGPLILQVI